VPHVLEHIREKEPASLRAAKKPCFCMTPWVSLPIPRPEICDHKVRKGQEAEEDVSVSWLRSLMPWDYNDGDYNDY
jgi:hypothetical protein